MSADFRLYRTVGVGTGVTAGAGIGRSCSPRHGLVVGIIDTAAAKSGSTAAGSARVLSTVTSTAGDLPKVV